MAPACWQLLDLGHGVVEGGEHEVLEHLDVVGVDGGGSMVTDGNSMPPVTRRP